LNFLGAPGISQSQQPKNQSVSLGATVIFSVNAFGTPPFTFQWRSNGVAIAGATNRTITLTNVMIEFRANYSVVVSNSLSSVTSQSARLDVDPTFTKITSGDAVQGTGVSYACSWGDYDNDGFLDLFVGRNLVDNNIGADGRNLLLRNNGDGTFTKITSGRIVNDGSGTYVGLWGDYDNDGSLDLLD